tara:strand:+ start:362 stop:508 length:147 start_codon:yes stop_codon:yes gene_type:complete
MILTSPGTWCSGIEFYKPITIQKSSTECFEKSCEIQYLDAKGRGGMHP